MAGRPVENIYDYTYDLNVLEVGQAVRIKVLRGGATTELEVYPSHVGFRESEVRLSCPRARRGDEQ